MEPSYTDSLIVSYEKYAHQRATSPPAEFKEREKAEFLKLLQAEKRKSILEIGCGTGQDAQSFQAQGFQVLALDTTPTMVQLTKERGVPARHLDCYNLDRIRARFDAVYSMNCLLHIPQKDISRILCLIAARLNKSGLLYLGLWSGEDFEGILEEDSYRPKRFFSLRKTETLLKVVQQSFSLEYFRNLEPRPGMFFNSLIGRKP